jgi:hypothetical protein
MVMVTEKAAAPIANTNSKRNKMVIMFSIFWS